MVILLTHFPSSFLAVLGDGIVPFTLCVAVQSTTLHSSGSCLVCRDHDGGLTRKSVSVGNDQCVDIVCVHSVPVELC